VNLREAREATAHIEDPEERADAICEMLVAVAEVDAEVTGDTPDDPDFPTGAIVKPRKFDQGNLPGVVAGPGEVTGDVDVRWYGTDRAVPQSVDRIIRVDQAIAWGAGQVVLVPAGINGDLRWYTLTDLSIDDAGCLSIHLKEKKGA
jgi:hypothetical protein